MFSRLHRHRPELRQNLSVRGYFTHVTYDKNLWVIRHAQIGMQFHAPATSLWQSEHIRERVGPHTCGPDQRMRLDCFARLQTHEGGANLCNRFSEAHFHATLLKRCLSISTQIVLERGEHFFAPLHNDDPRLVRGELVVIAREKVVEQICERACGLNARWPGADNNKIERAVGNQSGVAVGRFKSFQNAVAERDRMYERVEWKCMLGCPRRVEIIDSRSP